ncbi:hypothetical protein AKJ65_06330 [candidate division MSBL1 archaeon SCGC-AAA259E19]|uniref:Uncharacterized protein n=1 Tax=candidate division MSBL1 archaeon SCGC-AAA259E19 TaxID=1698264 RepID=A0A133UGT2_9EURY|nr:hypothetical protein AKJ65_06330 [candidate division MSBL1 archaeon SCGC-AAA259E19]
MLLHRRALPRDPRPRPVDGIDPPGDLQPPRLRRVALGDLHEVLVLPEREEGGRRGDLSGSAKDTLRKEKEETEELRGEVEKLRSDLDSLRATLAEKGFPAEEG